MRPEPLFSNILVALFSPLLLVPGLFFLLGAAVSMPKTELLTWGVGFGGAMFTGAGALLAQWAYRGLTTLVRFTQSDDDVTLEWRRGGKVAKTERIARADVVDVAVSDTPASGGDVYGLALGTRLGDIALSNSFTPQRNFYAKERDRVCAFLNVPARG